MGLLGRILRRLYLIASQIIQSCLIDDNYENQVLVWFANFFTVIAFLAAFGFVLYALIFAISLEIFCKAILLAYLAALAWEKFSKHLTSFAQEMYLLMSTVGYTVLVGIAIQIHRLQGADAKTLLFYWAFLLSFGFIIWGVTVFNVTADPEFKPVLPAKKLEYKHRFRRTTIAEDLPLTNQAQAYLKKIKSSGKW